MASHSPRAGGRPADVKLRRLRTDELSPSDLHAIRALLAAAFGTDGDDRFTDDDWEHALGGMHVVPIGAARSWRMQRSSSGGWRSTADR